ncbi:MAG: IS1634 family transposase [Sphaerospermopsis kisseleviana]
MKLKPQEIEIQNIDHLGIVAGIIDAIGIVEIINELIGVEKGEKVNAGQVVKAMIINGLGFVSKPLYMFPEYFETIACEHLIGTGIKPEYLNDDKLGRVMDKLFIKGLDTIFFIIALKAAQRFGVSLSTSHLDSSSMHVHGLYNTSLPEVIFESQKVGDNQELEEIAVKSPKEITITYGYSRDHRPDLKQFIIEMICSGDGDIPIFLKLASGNQADSSCFGKIAVEYQKQLEVNSLIVADSALYTEPNLKMMSELRWLCRVPLSIKAAKSLISTVLDSKELSDDSMLSEYKAQQSCERGFGFLKDPLFFADSIFLKSPERIESLGMIMGLCLLVYTLAQRQIRNALKESKSTIKNQLGKATDRPTLRWIFQCFQCIHLVTLNQEEHISNWNKDRDFILRLLPDDCLRYYQLFT